MIVDISKYKEKTLKGPSGERAEGWRFQIVDTERKRQDTFSAPGEYGKAIKSLQAFLSRNYAGRKGIQVELLP